MASRTFDEARRWAAEGTALVRAGAAGLTDADLRAPSTLPGWSVGNLVAHVAANGDALVNLVTWAKTGIENPMYAGPSDRADGIAKGDTLSAAEALAWLDRSITALDIAMDGLTDEEWTHEVVTAQGRTVPATEIPWMRTREVMVHAVDLARAVSFADLPTEFCEALIADILTKRGELTLPEGSPQDLAAWLAGRPHGLTDAPELGPWL